MKRALQAMYAAGLFLNGQKDRQKVFGKRFTKSYVSVILIVRYSQEIITGGYIKI